MAELEREGRRFAVCTVVRTTGSTPQVVGAKLLVDDLGRLTGTLGGGCVEGDAFEEAKRVLETGDTSLREYELTEDLAWDTGLVCGGTMWISIEPGERAAPRWPRSAGRRARRFIRGKARRARDAAPPRGQGLPAERQALRRDRWRKGWFAR